jgi:small basic protein (TIGR04137 family)
MTIDKTLKRKGRLSRSRNVLKRDERIAQMKFEERWTEGQSPLGLAKTRVAKSAIGKKKKKAKDEEEGAEGTAAAPAAAAAAPAPAAKGAPAKKK